MFCNCNVIRKWACGHNRRRSIFKQCPQADTDKTIPLRKSERAIHNQPEQSRDHDILVLTMNRILISYTHWKYDGNNPSKAEKKISGVSLRITIENGFSLPCGYIFHTFL